MAHKVFSKKICQLSNGCDAVIITSFTGKNIFRKTLLTFITMLAWLTVVLSGSAETAEEDAQEKVKTFSPGQAVVVNTNLAWSPTHWAGNLNTSSFDKKYDGRIPVFKVTEPGRRKVWLDTLKNKVDTSKYPIAVLTYIARGTNPNSNAYVIWVDDGTGPDSGGKSLFVSSKLIADGEVHELRRDVASLNPNGPLSTIALGVHQAEDSPEAEFHLLGLRFEADPEKPNPEPESHTINILVKDKDDQPLSGVTVSGGEWSNWARTAITDKNGQASIETFKRPDGKMDILDFSKDGYESVQAAGSNWQGNVGYYRAKAQVLESTADSLTVRLTPRPVFSGLIADAVDGKPIKNASIRARYLPGLVEVTGDDGRFRIADRMRSGRDYHFIIEAEGYATEYVDLRPMNGQDIERTLKLPKGITMRGLVTNDVGAHLGDAKLRFSPINYHYRNEWKTDEDGRYEIKGVKPETRYNMNVACDGYLVESEHIFFPTEDAGKVIEKNYVMRTGYKFSGKVLDENGDPMHGVTVDWGGRCWGDGRKIVKTDAQGKFHISDIVNSYGATLYISFPGCGTLSKEIRKDTLAANKPMDFVLKPEQIISGVVADEDGKPVSGVTVKPGSNNAAIPQEARTNAEGRFTLRALPEGEYALAAYGGGLSSLQTSKHFKTGTEDVRLVMTRPVPLSGIVVDKESGQPIKRFNVKLRYSSHTPGQRGPGISSDLYENGLDFSNPEGKFTVPRQAKNINRRLLISAPGYRAGSFDRLKPGEQHTLKLQKMKVGKLTVRILDADSGAPISGQTVKLLIVKEQYKRHINEYSINDDSPYFSQNIKKKLESTTDEAGECSFEADSKGPHILRCRAKGYARFSSLVKEITEKPLEIKLQKGLTLTGQLKGFPGKSGDYYIAIHGNKFSRQQISLDDEMKFKVEGIVPGLLSITLMETIGNMTTGILRRQFTVKSEGENHCILDMADYHILKGKVTKSDQPLSRISVHTRNHNSSFYTNDNGEYRLYILETGKQEVIAQNQGHFDPRGEIRPRFSKSVTIDIKDKEQTLDIAISESEISGKLVYENGDAYANSNLQLHKKVDPALRAKQFEALYENNPSLRFEYYFNQELKKKGADRKYISYFQTNAAGEFKFAGLEKGEYILVPSLSIAHNPSTVGVFEDYSPGEPGSLSFKVETNDQKTSDLTFTIKKPKRSETLLLTVSGSDTGKDLTEGCVRLYRKENGCTLWKKLGEESPVNFKVPAGKYQLQIFAPTYCCPAGIEVDLTGGEDKKLSLALERGGDLSVENADKRVRFRYFLTSFPEGAEKKIPGYLREGKLLPESAFFRFIQSAARQLTPALPVGKYSLCGMLTKYEPGGLVLLGTVRKDFTITAGEKIELEISEEDIEKDALPDFLTAAK